ncbi:MAG: type II secretion system protein [Candidatus Berkelbacteria bacterium]|nr:type II secretion system protein [Candidatus Berkelbacteria bacterium]
MRKRAFTLIELLVVVAIIAILAVTVVVSLNGAQRRARESAALSNINQALSMAIQCKTLDAALLANAGVDPKGTSVCASSSDINATWPKLSGYTYTVTSTVDYVTAVTFTTGKTDDHELTCALAGSYVPSCTLSTTDTFR